MRLPDNRLMALAALALLATQAGATPAGPVMPDRRPMLPPEAPRYDAVGRADVGTGGGGAVTLAHRTLPLPSFVEVTSLDTGRTILALVDRRGPTAGNALIELSPGAAAQLGIVQRTAVRVRQVSPAEPERAVLQMGQAAPLRLESPRPLVAALLRKLAVQDGALPPAPLPMPPLAAKPVPAADELAKPSASAEQPATPAKAPVVAVAAKPAVAKPSVTKPAARADAHLVVQLGAYSTKARADASAADVGGAVTRSGKLFRVRLGPFANSAQASAALAKARTAGYGDARIQHAD